MGSNGSLIIGIYFPSITCIRYPPASDKLGNQSSNPVQPKCRFVNKLETVIQLESDVTQKSLNKFLDDHRMLVEPACGAALAAIYSDIIKKLQTEGKLGAVKTAVLIVCGGNSINLDQLEHLQKVVGIK